MKRVASLTASLLLVGCAAQIAPIADEAADEIQDVQEWTSDLAVRQLCQGMSVREAFQRFGSTEELWRSYLTVCGRGKQLPRPEGAGNE